VSPKRRLASRCRPVRSEMAGGRLRRIVFSIMLPYRKKVRRSAATGPTSYCVISPGRDENPPCRIETRACPWSGTLSARAPDRGARHQYEGRPYGQQACRLVASALACGGAGRAAGRNGDGYGQERWSTQIADLNDREVVKRTLVRRARQAPEVYLKNASRLALWRPSQSMPVRP